MKRLHVHVGVKDLSEGVRFYNALFGAEPVKLKADYAKWVLDDPCVNFAISTRAARIGVDHLGLQIDDPKELAVLRDQLSRADVATRGNGETTCCYARSDKSWVEDPSGIAWEAYHTTEDAQVYHGGDAPDRGVCCAAQPEIAGRT